MPLEFPKILLRARKRLLSLHYTAKSGHIGGNLSCLDAMLTLHHRIINPSDRFILSKGHAAGALYVTLWSLGKLADADLETFCKDGTALPSHPSGENIPGLLFPTGSLGHGPSLAAGLALAAVQQKSTRQVYCMCSDGEWQEGACWEALIFSVHHQLDNLTIFVDQNGLQGFGTTTEVASVKDLTPRFESFGASVISVDGHDPEAIIAAVKQKKASLPHIVVLQTRKGRGLHFEGALESHYLPLTKEQYEAGYSAIIQEEKGI